MWEQIRANKRRSIVVIGGMACLLLVLGYAIGFAVGGNPGGQFGLMFAVGLWLLLMIVAVESGSGLLLMSAKAEEIQHKELPMLFNVVEEMTIAAGLPKRPKIYLMDTPMPNAFAVGTPEKSAVAVTTGLLSQLNRDELQGVIAHEIGHIHNHDTRFMTIAGVMVSAIVIIAEAFSRSMFYVGRGSRRSSSRGGGGAQAVMVILAILMAILAPIAAHMLYFACSRKREYLADASAALFTRYPEGLASALVKIERGARGGPRPNRAVAPMYIINPLQGAAASSLFSTHPPTEKRVRILRSMAGAGYDAYNSAFGQVMHERVLSGRSVAEASNIGVREPGPAAKEDGLTRARKAMDVLHKMGGLLFLTCVCGLKLKVPRQYEGKEVQCPACGKHLRVPSAKAEPSDSQTTA